METSPDSVALELYQIRISPRDRTSLDDFWQAVNEQRLDADSRRDLISNGIRAGVLGSDLPDLLAAELNPQGGTTEISSVQLVTNESLEPRVARRVLQLNRHETATVQASEVRDELHVLFNGKDGLQGNPYSQVQAVYTLRAQSVPGQRVSLSLTPELQHGEVRPRYTGSADQGIFLVTPSREREIYDQLKLNAELAPGEILVASCLPDSAGSLGHAFHATDGSEQATHKLLLIRLLQVPESEILAEAGPVQQSL